MRETRNILYEYWRKEKHVIEYLFTCIIFTIVLENNRDILEQIPFVHDLRISYSQEAYFKAKEEFSLPYHFKKLLIIYGELAS